MSPVAPWKDPEAKKLRAAVALTATSNAWSPGPTESSSAHVYDHLATQFEPSVVRLEDPVKFAMDCCPRTESVDRRQSVQHQATPEEHNTVPVPVVQLVKAALQRTSTTGMEFPEHVKVTTTLSFMPPDPSNPLQWTRASLQCIDAPSVRGYICKGNTFITFCGKEASPSQDMELSPGGSRVAKRLAGSSFVIYLCTYTLWLFKHICMDDYISNSEGANPTEEQESSPPSRELHCSGCIVWRRQQTWLCVVPLLIGFIGLGLSLMLLRWIVVGSVKEYVPPDHLESNRIGQDPIFLSKPSSFPKPAETTTMYTGTNPSFSTITLSTRGTMPITARVTTQGTLRSTTARRSPPPPTSTPGGPLTSTAPGTLPFRLTPTVSHVPFSTSSSKFFLHDSTPSWTQSKSGESTTDIHSVLVPKFPTTTYTTERSEHFKPCTAKDLAYCLNEGECFIIETLAGNNKHCRCKEGYQGVRCDQYLPKTDSILSDPTEHLGIEFMESEEMYQRQIMSITCITIGLTVVAMLCVVLYFKTKKQRQKLRDQAKDVRFGKSYSLNTSELSTTESPTRNALQLENYTKPVSNIGEGRRKVLESQFSGPVTSPADSSISDNQSVKQQRYCQSSSISPRPLKRLSSLVPRPSPPLPQGSLSGDVEPRDVKPPNTNSQIQDQLAPTKLSLDNKRPSTTCWKSPESSLNIMHPAPSHCPIQLSALELEETGVDPYSWAASVPVTPSMMGEQCCVQVQVGSQETEGQQRPQSHCAELLTVSAPQTPLREAEGRQVEMLLDTVHQQIQILACVGRRPEDYELINERDAQASENTAFLPVVCAEERPFVVRKDAYRDCDPAK
ncbi:pro-neuregulin-3, membrane-bound isoform-like [Heptranchias perlo]|uniref:pro-neuregulin-3, membrane-bound isoform-like n=1 Tax=Heptranchias perlo TaxID=212740 RepID=UPI0035594417